MCPNTHFLITFADKLSVICILRSVLTLAHSITSATCFIRLFCRHSILCLPLSLTFPRLSAANLCSDCQKNESVLSAWKKIIFFARPPVTCHHVKEQTRQDKNPVCVGGGRNGVSLRERIRARPTRHSQEVLGGKWAEWGTPLCHISPSGCVWPACTHNIIYLYMSAFFFPLLSLSIFSSLFFGPMFWSSPLYLPLPSAVSLCLPPVAHLWIYRSTVWWCQVHLI